MKSATARPKLRPASVAIVAIIAYAVVLGGTVLGELQPSLRLVSAVLGTVLVVGYVVSARRADAIDRGVVVALVAFTLACVLSLFPRQSLDAAMAAITYAAALFLARGAFGRPEGRSAAVATLMGLSALIAFTMAARWLPLVAEWWALTDWRVLPPLDLNLDATPWGHRHDAALLLVMLYPSWFVTRPGPRRAAIATVVGAMTLAVVVVDGSRTLWLAVLAAALVTVAPRAVALVRRDRRILPVALGAVLAGGVIVVVTGLAATAAERGLTLSTVGARTAMWDALTDLWGAHPIAGIGPGGFPWALQLTGYFDANIWAPRHPDSVPFQLVAEAGLLGVVAVGILAVTLVPPLLRARLAPATFALTAFVVSGIGASPTDFGFLVAVTIVWAALAVPRFAPAVPKDAGRRWPTVASLVGVAVIGVASAATLAAAFAYGDARGHVHDGELAEARNGLDTAVFLDPGMALYARQRGTLRLLEGEPSSAVADLARAAELNPSDDVAWRTLALALDADGDEAGAAAALGRAVAVQRSDPTNLLLLASRQVAEGREEDAAAALAEVVQAWPQITRAPGWEATLPESVSTEDVIASAVERWEAGLDTPRPFENQAAILAALARRPDLVPEAVELGTLGSRLTRAGYAVHACERDADAVLSATTESDRRVPQYWRLLVIRAAQTGTTADDAWRLFSIMTGAAVEPERADELLNPVDENSGQTFSPDGWGYRRLPIAWPRYGAALPSPWAGEAAWMESGGCG